MISQDYIVHILSNIEPLALLASTICSCGHALRNRSPKRCCCKSSHHATVLGVLWKHNAFVETRLQLYRAYFLQQPRGPLAMPATGQQQWRWWRLGTGHTSATMRRAHLPNTGIIEGRDSMEHGEGRKEHSNRNAARQRPSKIPGKPVQEVWPCQWWSIARTTSFLASFSVSLHLQTWTVLILDRVCKSCALGVCVFY